MQLRDKIVEIKSCHPEFGNGRIAKLVGCSKNTVKNNLYPERQRKLHRERVRRFRKTKHPLYRKIVDFCNDYRRGKVRQQQIFSLNDFLQTLGSEPRCYLTGEKINILDGKTYALDHKVPISRGGSAAIGNCGLAAIRVNRSKSDMTPEEFLALCKQVLLHNGYSVTEPNNGPPLD